MSNPLTHTKASGFGFEPGLHHEQWMALRLDSEEGQRLAFSVFIGLRSDDPLVAAGLYARLRRALPALVEECAREAEQEIYPQELH